MTKEYSPLKGFRIHWVLEFEDPYMLINIKHMSMSNTLCILIEDKFKIVANVSHPFVTGGYSGCFILADSHLTWHSFPEVKQMSLDLYSCIDKPEETIEQIKKDLKLILNCEIIYEIKI